MLQIQPVLQPTPVLQLTSVLPFLETGALPNTQVDLHLMPGACALIETSNPARTTALADLCSGMVALRQGEARFMGYDWTSLKHGQAAALRGRIGRIHHRGAWVGMLGTHVNIMMAQLHHTRTPEATIARMASKLAQEVGLPALPTVLPDQLSDDDRMRASCVRAFLGEPQLLLLESAITADQPGLTTPFLDLLARALERGAAAVCFTRDVAFWRAQSFPVDQLLRLTDDGLFPVTRV